MYPNAPLHLSLFHDFCTVPIPFCMQEADARKKNLETKEQELVQLEQKLYARERVSLLSMLYGNFSFAFLKFFLII